MAKTALKTASSAIVKRTVVMPVRPKNADLRTREYLTDDEVQRLAEAAKANRYGQRDATMILIAYALANKGHDTRALQAYLGHKNIQHTVRYTELSPARFKDFWRV